MVSGADFGVFAAEASAVGAYRRHRQRFLLVAKSADIGADRRQLPMMKSGADSRSAV